MNPAGSLCEVCGEPAIGTTDWPAPWWAAILRSEEWDGATVAVPTCLRHAQASTWPTDLNRRLDEEAGVHVPPERHARNGRLTHVG